MAEVVNLQQVLDTLAASGVETDTLLTAVGEMASVPAGGFNTPVNTLYTLESANGTPLANVINISQQAASDVSQIGNSNLAGAAGTFTNSQGASAAAGQTAGMSSFFGGAKKFLNQTLVGTEHFGVGTIAASIAAVAVGAKAGKTFDSLVYKGGKLLGFDMAESLNPQTWDSITYDMADTGLEGVYKRGLQMLLGLDSNTGKVQAYLPETSFNYLAYTLAQMGVFDTAGAPYVEDDTVSDYVENPRIVQPVHYTKNSAFVRTVNQEGNTFEATYTMLTGNAYFCFLKGTTGGPMGFVFSDEPYTVHAYITKNGKVWQNSTLTPTTYGTYTSGGKSVDRYFNIGIFPQNATTPDISIPCAATDTLVQGNMNSSAAASLVTELAWIIKYGTIHTPSSYPGTGDQPGATIPAISSSNTEQEVADTLANTFPELNDDRVEMPVAVPGTIPKPVTYVQVPLPATVVGNNPTVEPTATPQADPNIDPQTATDPLQALLLKLLTAKQAINMPNPEADPEQYPEGKPEEPVNTNPAGVGIGVTPPLVVPVGSASALWAVYNPTQAQIDELGAWLWSNNFVDQLLKMFNDPMQAIIGLHKTFIPPITGAAQDIKVGYLNSGVSALTVPVQYSSVDCGTINCAEYFGSVFDYAPYTRVYLYLPFIGFKELDVAQVMRGRINVKYRGDAFTGCCLAEVSVTRDGDAGGVLYTYSGDCAARYPLSHGSYMGIVNAIAGIGIGIGTALAGAPSIGVAGAVGMAQHARANVEHSGSFSGNSGAMGIKKPYLVITRPQTAMANNYAHFTGQPSNSNVVLGSASGYVRVKECHVEDIATATDAEKQMIEAALKTGVII